MYQSTSAGAKNARSLPCGDTAMQREAAGPASAASRLRLPAGAAVEIQPELNTPAFTREILKQPAEAAPQPLRPESAPGLLHTMHHMLKRMWEARPALTAANLITSALIPWAYGACGAGIALMFDVGRSFSIEGALWGAASLAALQLAHLLSSWNISGRRKTEEQMLVSLERLIPQGIRGLDPGRLAEQSEPAHTIARVGDNRERFKVFCDDICSMTMKISEGAMIFVYLALSQPWYVNAAGAVLCAGTLGALWAARRHAADLEKAEQGMNEPRTGLLWGQFYIKVREILVEMLTREKLEAVGARNLTNAEQCRQARDRVTSANAERQRIVDTISLTFGLAPAMGGLAVAKAWGAISPFQALLGAGVMLRLYYCARDFWATVGKQAANGRYIADGMRLWSNAPMPALAEKPEPQSAQIRPPREIARQLDFRRSAPPHIAWKDLVICNQAGEVLLAEQAGDLRPGTRIAVIGPNGCGKSQLGRFLAGLHSPSSGILLVNGEPLTAFNADKLRWWREQLGVFNAELKVLDGLSVRQLLTHGSASEPGVISVEEAASMLGIHDRIMQMPQGYETLVGGEVSWERLNTGLRRLLHLADTLRQNRPVVILDEFDANLDAGRRAQILNCFAPAGGKERTILMVVHDLEIAAQAEAVWLMRNGRLEIYPQAAFAAEKEGIYRWLEQENLRRAAKELGRGEEFLPKQRDRGHKIS